MVLELGGIKKSSSRGPEGPEVRRDQLVLELGTSWDSQDCTQVQMGTKQKTFHKTTTIPKNQFFPSSEIFVLLPASIKLFLIYQGGRQSLSLSPLATSLESFKIVIRTELKSEPKDESLKLKVNDFGEKNKKSQSRKLYE